MTQPHNSLDAGAAVIRLTTAVGERALEVRAESGLSALQLQVLRLATVGADMSTLARELQAPKSTVTSAVDQLESMDLAVRVIDQDDRRRQIVRCTAAGDARLRDFDVALAGRVDELLTILSPDRARRLRELMRRLPGASVPLPLAVPR